MSPAITWSDLLHPGDATDFFSRRPFPPFEPNAAGYSEANTLWLAELCRLVYRHDIEERINPPQPTRSSFLAQANLKQRCFFNSNATGTQAMLVESRSTPAFFVLAFRGTEQNVNDFVSDLNTGLPPRDRKAIVVHEGFARGLDSVWAKVDAELAQLSGAVFYTGHSLGAALATLAATRRAPHSVYTFGSPLVGNEAFVTSLRNVRIYRVVNASDAVTLVPPAALGYRHAGELHMLKAPPTRGSFDPRTWFRRLQGPPKALADHAPINYVDRAPETE